MGWMEPWRSHWGLLDTETPPAGSPTRTGWGPRPAILTFAGHCVSQQCGHDLQICGPRGHSFKKFLFG